MNTYIKKEGYYELHITGNKNNGIILIDEEDYDKVKKYTWYIEENRKDDFYVRSKIKYKHTSLHRYILDISDKEDVVDHIDRNTFNNRKSNLRIVDRSTNSRNLSMNKNNKSGRTGVRLEVDKRTGVSNWRAQFGGKSLGNFKQKSFSIKKYGNDEAYRLACQQREEWEKEYNVLTEKGDVDYAIN